MNEMSGYIEIKVGEDVLPFKFGTNAWALFCNLRGIELGEIGDTGVFGTWDKDEKGKPIMIKTPDIMALRDIFHAGYVSALRIRGKTEVLTAEGLLDLLDEVPGSMQLLESTLLESKFLGKKLKELGKEVEEGNFQSPGQ
jgi:hypothetical protein